MPKLLAISRADGWAFVRDDGEISLVKPPYKRAFRSVVAGDAVEKAIQTHGFQATDVDFGDWADLVSYLQTGLVETRKGNRSKAPDVTELAKDILGHAPLNVIKSCLQRVRTELIPSGEWLPALRLLDGLYHSETTMQHTPLRDEVVDLLEQCALRLAGDKQRDMDQTAEEELSRRFPNAAGAYDSDAMQELARKITRQQQVFVVGV